MFGHDDRAPQSRSSVDRPPLSALFFEPGIVVHLHEQDQVNAHAVRNQVVEHRRTQDSDVPGTRRYYWPQQRGDAEPTRDRNHDRGAQDGVFRDPRILGERAEPPCDHGDSRLDLLGLLLRVVLLGGVGRSGHTREDHQRENQYHVLHGISFCHRW